MLDCAHFASQVESLCRCRHWSADAVEQLADLDEALHDSDLLGEYAAAAAFLGSWLSPERWLEGRTLVQAAVQIAEAVRVVPLPDGTGPSALWDESLARLTWIARWFRAFSSEPDQALTRLLAAFDQAAFPCSALAQRLEATTAQCLTSGNSTVLATMGPESRLLRYVCRPEVVALVRHIDNTTASDIEPPASAIEPETVETIEEFATRMRVSPGTIHEWRRLGMPAYQPVPNGVIRINVRDALAWLYRLKPEQGRSNQPAAMPSRGTRKKTGKHSSIRIGGAEFPI